MDVTIRQAEPWDVAAIQAFIQESFGALAPFKTVRRWEWQFVLNPYRQDDPSNRIPVWIAVIGERVVGQIAVQPCAVVVDGDVHKAGWIVDVMVLPAYRGQGLGHRLYAAVAQSVPILLMVKMAPSTRRIAQRSGAIDLGEAWQFSHWVWLRPDDVRRYVLKRLEKRSRLRAIARIACDRLLFHRVSASIANTAIAARNIFADGGAIERDIAEIARFDAWTDRAWQSIAARFEALSVRDSRFLNWRFVECPDLNYRIFVARADRLILGWCVLRRAEPVELRLGIIADLFAAPDDEVTLKSLLQYALLHFGGDVASIECVTSRPEIARLLRKTGFFRTRSTMAIGSFADHGLQAQARLLSGGWLFTRGDHDWDQINLA